MVLNLMLISPSKRRKVVNPFSMYQCFIRKHYLFIRFDWFGKINLSINVLDPEIVYVIYYALYW